MSKIEKEMENLKNIGTTSAVESDDSDSEEESQGSCYLEESGECNSAFSDADSVLSDFEEWKEWSRKRTH